MIICYDIIISYTCIIEVELYVIYVEFIQDNNAFITLNQFIVITRAHNDNIASTGEKASQASNQDYKTRTSAVDSLQLKSQVPPNGPFDKTE